MIATKLTKDYGASHDSMPSLGPSKNEFTAIVDLPKNGGQ
jgi:hypothetical protein